MSPAPASPFGSDIGLRIVERYRLLPRLAQARSMLARDELDWLLRSHLLAPVAQHEIGDRDNLDELLAGLGILFMSGFDSPETLGALGLPVDDMMAVLCNEDVRRYHEVHYPYAPPILLREALLDPQSGLGPELALEREDESWPGAFRQFLMLDASFNAPRDDVPQDLEMFLSVLDDYVIGEWHLDRLRYALASEQGMRGLLQERSGRRLLAGLQDFLDFSEALDDFLESLEALPLFRGLVWLNYGYWYGAGGERMQDVARWISEVLVTLEARTEMDEEAERERDTAGEIEQLQQVMGRLTSAERQALPLVDASDGILAGWQQRVTRAKDVL